MLDVENALGVKYTGICLAEGQALKKMKLENCSTLMLDMDGTLLDLAYDHRIWLEEVPRIYADQNGLSQEEANQFLLGELKRLQGTLAWYSLDFWTEKLDIDVPGLHQERAAEIDYLPGAQAFLERAAASAVRVLLVTNSQQGLLDLKIRQTGLDAYFDAIYSTHAFGYPKEVTEFWTGLAKVESFDPTSTVFIDDNEAVLAGADAYGVAQLLQVAQPDSRHSPRAVECYRGIAGVRELSF